VRLWPPVAEIYPLGHSLVMPKWVTVLLVLLAAAFIVYSMALGQSLRRASLINGINQLRVAEADHAKQGYITNYPTSGYRVWLSTNTVTIGGTQYQCFAEVAGGWGWNGGTLAMNPLNFSFSKYPPTQAGFPCRCDGRPFDKSERNQARPIITMFMWCCSPRKPPNFGQSLPRIQDGMPANRVYMWE
jgi:hypothetical protein